MFGVLFSLVTYREVEFNVMHFAKLTRKVETRGGFE